MLDMFECEKTYDSNSEELLNPRELKRGRFSYIDPTADEAIANVMREQEEKDRFHKLLKAIFEICELSDFHLEERIVVKYLRSGKIWR